MSDLFTTHCKSNNACTNTELLETLKTIDKANTEHEAGLNRPIGEVFSELKAEFRK